MHWLIAIQNKQMRGKFELDKSHLGHPSIRLNNIALDTNSQTKKRSCYKRLILLVILIANI